MSIPVVCSINGMFDNLMLAEALTIILYQFLPFQVIKCMELLFDVRFKYLCFLQTFVHTFAICYTIAEDSVDTICLQLIFYICWFGVLFLEFCKDDIHCCVQIILMFD